MAVKKENRRMVDMLERMGMIKKEEDDAVGEAAPAPEAEPTAQAEQVTPAAPQAAPVPAPTPPAENPQPDTSKQNAGVAEKEVCVRTVQAPEKRTVIAGSSLSSLGDGFWDDAPSEPEAVERFMEIDALYDLFQMKADGVDTVYLLEEYIKTLPDSLPADLRRNIIVRIVQASGFDFDRLLSDGIDRVSKLNDYAAEFAARTDAIVTRQNETIADFERQIELVRAVISERKNLHKKQFLNIENEAQRLKKILDFITK